MTKAQMLFELLDITTSFLSTLMICNTLSENKIVQDDIFEEYEKKTEIRRYLFIMSDYSVLAMVYDKQHKEITEIWVENGKLSKI